jgi:hypothetical protein
MAKNTDSIWALIGGLFLGAAFTTGVWFLNESSQPRPQATPESIQIIDPGTGPITADTPAQTPPPPAPSAESIAAFNAAVDDYAAIAAALFGDAAIYQEDSPLSKRATEILDGLVTAGDPIGHHPAATLLIYSMAAADLGQTMASVQTLRTAWAEDQKNREAQIRVVESERDTWKRQAQSAMSAAEYNRQLAAQTAANAAATAAAYQQQQATALKQQTPAPAAPSYTYTAAAPTPALNAREKFEQMQRRYPPPSQPVEIEMSTGLGSDGQVYNVDLRPGGRLEITR